MVFPSWLRGRAAMIVMTGLLAMGAGCHRGTASNGSVDISGYVNFNRQTPQVPGSVDVVTRARGVVVRVFQLYSDLDRSGQAHQNWRLAATTTTDTTGFYSVGSTVFPGYPTFIEVDSVFQQFGGHNGTLQVIADANGVFSTTPAANRPLYAFWVDLNSAVIPPSTTVVVPDNTVAANPVTVLTGPATVNVDVGDSDNWYVTPSTWYVPGSNTGANSATQQQSAPITALPLGGKPLGILDSAYVFSYYYGDPTPSQAPGGVFDLHYYPGRTESARSFAIYDPTRTPLSVVAGKAHYFGSLAGGPTFDDSWDQSVIWQILGRNNLYSQGKTALFPTGQSSLASLSPDLAVVDGLGDAMAASLLQTPLITDLTAAAPYVTRDIRTLLPTQTGINSPANLAALAWRLTIVAAVQAPPPGVPTPWATVDVPATWATINPAVMVRFFTLITPSVTYNATHGTVIAPTDINSIYAQVGRLLEGKGPTDPIDLAQDRFHSNANLIALLDPFGILWTGDAPLDLPPLAVNWSPDAALPAPNSTVTPLAPFTLTMAAAQQITDPVTGLPVYPNESQGEVAYAKAAMVYDGIYNLSVTLPPAPAPQPLPTTFIEIEVDGQIWPAYQFFPGVTAPQSLTLIGSLGDITNPTWHFIRIRLVTANALEPNPLAVTVNLVPTP